MSAAPALNGLETADELLFLGFAVAHVAAYYERQRLARIARVNAEAFRMWRARGGGR